MKGSIRHVISFALAAGCIICLIWAFLYSSMPEERTEISILQLETPCDKKTALAYQKNMEKSQDTEKIPFAYWGEQQEEDIQNRDLGRSTRAAVITVCGDSSLVLESSQILDSDISGYCLIGKQTSQELFGSAQAAGQILELDGRSYQVAGILTSADCSVLIQADRQKEVLMDKVSLRIAGTENRQERMRLFLGQTGIAGKEIPIHYYRTLGNFMVYILPVLLFAAVLCELIKIIHVCKNRPVLWLLLLLLFLAMLAVYVWILDIPGGYPVELLPSKWSDFDFWSNLWLQKAQDLEFLIQIEKSQPQLMLFYRFLKSGGYSMLAVLFARMSLKEAAVRKGRLAAMLCCPLISFLAVIMFPGGTGAVAQHRIIWLFLPAYLTGKYVVEMLQDRLEKQIWHRTVIPQPEPLSGKVHELSEEER